MLRLIFPSQCPCGEWDTAVCDACLEEIDMLIDVTDLCPRLSDLEGRRLWPTWAASDYLGPIGPVIRAWKNEPHAALTSRLTAVIATVVEKTSPIDTDRVVVVPAPSGPARYRAGTFVAGHIADAVAEGMARRGSEAISATLLRPRAGHQKGRSRTDRSHRAPIHVERVQPQQIILVDDVVTTGATVSDCARALAAAGHHILGTFCVSSARRRPKPPESV